MANLREQARAVDWEQARADGLAILRKEATLASLPAANRDNLGRARDIMGKLAENEGYYRQQSLARMATYDDLKKEYVNYIHERDRAALQGVIGGGGLAVVNLVDMIGYGFSARGVPLAKFYITVRGVADQGVKVAGELFPSALPTAPVVPFTQAPAVAGGPLPNLSGGSGISAPGGSGGAGSAAAPPPAATLPKTSDEQIQAAANQAQLVRDMHKAVEETSRLNRGIPGVDRFRGWTTPQTGKAEETTALKVSKGLGEGIDAALKIASSVADVRAARRGGDLVATAGAEVQLTRDVAQAGATAIDIANRAGKLMGNRGESGAFPVSAQVMKGLKSADQVLSIAQTSSNTLAAYYEGQGGNYDKAWQHARDGVTNAAKTFGAYGSQVEAAAKAAEALKRASDATTLRDKATSYLDYAGNAAKVGTIPGASDTGEAILKAREAVEQGFFVKESIDLRRQDTFRPNLDRLGRNIREDYDMYMHLSEFRPLFDLPQQFPGDSFSRTPPVILKPQQ
ncbi:hypothetical protein [Bradyrhizobium sp.]|uniref:hypothetical protein n=1 Tax=Bradyrhizobium sp. TaxID=376 RepID=UPI0040383B9A